MRETIFHRMRRSGRSGFTLIELMIVIVIIGLLATIGLSNFISLQKRGRYASCISNQRHIHEAALLYGSDNNIDTQNINVTILTAAGLITQEVGECPSSGNVDFDDYNVQYTQAQITSITCSILGFQHFYAP